MFSFSFIPRSFLLQWSPLWWALAFLLWGLLCLIFLSSCSCFRRCRSVSPGLDDRLGKYHSSKAEKDSGVPNPKSILKSVSRKTASGNKVNYQPNFSLPPEEFVEPSISGRRPPPPALCDPKDALTILIPYYRDATWARLTCSAFAPLISDPKRRKELVNQAARTYLNSVRFVSDAKLNSMFGFRAAKTVKEFLNHPNAQNDSLREIMYSFPAVVPLMCTLRAYQIMMARDHSAETLLIFNMRSQPNPESIRRLACLLKAVGVPPERLCVLPFKGLDVWCDPKSPMFPTATTANLSAIILNNSVAEWDDWILSNYLEFLSTQVNNDKSFVPPRIAYFEFECIRVDCMTLLPSLEPCEARGELLRKLFRKSRKMSNLTFDIIACSPACSSFPNITPYVSDAMLKGCHTVPREILADLTPLHLAIFRAVWGPDIFRVLTSWHDRTGWRGDGSVLQQVKAWMHTETPRRIKTWDSHTGDKSPVQIYCARDPLPLDGEPAKMNEFCQMWLAGFRLSASHPVRGPCVVVLNPTQREESTP